MAGPGRTQRRIVWMLGADSPRLSGREEGPRPGLGAPDVGTWGESTVYVHHLSFRERGRCGLGWATRHSKPGPGLLAAFLVLVTLIFLMRESIQPTG